MNALDIIVLFLVAALGLKGFLNGLIKEVAGIAAIVGGVFLASRFSTGLSDFLVAVFNMKSGASTTVISFIVLFAGLWFGITFLASMLSKAVDTSGMGIADKALGFVAAGGKIFLILSVIVFAVSNISLLQNKLQSFTKDSFMYAPMRATGGFIMKLKPEDLNASAMTQKVKEEAAKEALKTIKSPSNAESK